MAEKDIYKAQDEIEARIDGIDKIVEESKNNDPEFYEQLKTIFKS